MNLNDLLLSKGIDPKNVLVLRHSPKERKLKKNLRWLAKERPEVFNAYQQTQTERVERAMKRAGEMKPAGYVAAFIGHKPGKALFVGLYSVNGFKPITPKEYRQIPANVELEEYDVKGLTEESPRSPILWFDLVLMPDFYAHLRDKLIVRWPPTEKNWYRWAHKPKNKMQVLFPKSVLDIAIPGGDLEQAVIESLEKKPGKGQGFLLDKVLRLRLEQYAMEAAKEHLASLGFAWEDHSKNHPYDLRCKRRGKVLYVEVKGTTTDGEEIILTAGEVAFARGHKHEMGLFILHSIQVSENGGECVLAGGKSRPIIPWDVDQGCLKALSFMYEIPG